MKSIIKTIFVLTMLFPLCSENNVSANDLLNKTNDSQFTIVEGVLTKYNGQDEILVIPEGVTKIDDFVFQNNSIIKRVELPDSLLYIGMSAFYSCSNLDEVIMKDSVIHIDMGAFYNCPNLLNVTLSESLEWVGKSAFSNTPWLEQMEREFFFFIVNNILIKANNLTGKITIPDGVITIAPDAFAFSGITEVIIPDSVKTIGSAAFARCIALTKVTMGDGVTTMGSDAFEGCYRLKEVKLSNSLTSLEIGVFSDCYKLESLILPNSLKTLRWAFSQSKKIREVFIPKSVTTFVGDVFDQCSDDLILYVEKNSKVESFAKKYRYTYTYFNGVTDTSNKMTKSYTVKSGDTLYKISKKLLGSGNRYNEIIKLSKLKSTKIIVGQKLIIPYK